MVDHIARLTQFNIHPPSSISLPLIKIRETECSIIVSFAARRGYVTKFWPIINKQNFSRLHLGKHLFSWKADIIYKAPSPFLILKVVMTPVSGTDKHERMAIV